MHSTTSASNQTGSSLSNNKHQLSELDLAGFREWFDHYTSSFISKDAVVETNIKLKYEHTLRVCEAAQDIGIGLGLSPYDLRIAQVAALFHDLGRFEQFLRHRTFSDRHSFNHAIFGAGLLIGKKVLAKLEKEEQHLITRCVWLHNVLALPVEPDPNLNLHARLLRDADKLDIWKVAIDYYQQRAAGFSNPGFELNLPEAPGFSPEVFDSLMHGETILFANLKNTNDFKLLQLSWVYDVNFVPTLQLLLKRGYLEQLRSFLPQDHDVDKLFNCLDNYIDQRLTNN